MLAGEAIGHNHPSPDPDSRVGGVEMGIAGSAELQPEKGGDAHLVFHPDAPRKGDIAP